MEMHVARDGRTVRCLLRHTQVQGGTHGPAVPCYNGPNKGKHVEMTKTGQGPGLQGAMEYADGAC